MQQIPFTHVKDKEADASKANSRQVLPVIEHVITLQLILDRHRQTRHIDTDTETDTYFMTYFLLLYLTTVPTVL